MREFLGFKRLGRHREGAAPETRNSLNTRIHAPATLPSACFLPVINRRAMHGGNTTPQFHPTDKGKRR